MRRAIVALTCTAAGMLGLLALPASGARADSSVTLPQLTNFHQIVVDSAENYVFLSEGLSSTALADGTDPGGGIVVTNLDGGYVTTLDAGDGVEGLALSSGGGTLYAAIAAKGQGAVFAIDVSTVTATNPTQTDYPLGTSDQPYSLAVQSGDLWVSYDAGSVAGAGGVGEIDLTAASPAFAPVPAMGTWHSAPDLAADPSDQNVLVAAQPGIDPAEAATLDTATDTAMASQTDLGSGGSGTECSTEDQIAVVPGGTQFIAGCESPETAELYGTGAGGLASPVHGYANAGTDAPDAVAISAGGTVAVGYLESQTVDIYQPDGTLLNALSLPATGYLANAGLAWSADGSEVFAISQDYTGGYSLTVFDDPTLTRSTLTLTGPATAVLDSTFTLTGSLTLGSGVVPSGTTVSITRTGPGGSTTPAAIPVTSHGTFTFTDKPTALGTYTYTATYAGVAGTIESATATSEVTVALDKATIALDSPAFVTYGDNVTIAGKLSLQSGSPAAGTAITVVRTEAGSKATKKFNVRTKAGGGFTVTDVRPAKGKYTYTATYKGNQTTTSAKTGLAVTVTRTVPSLAVKTSAADYRYGTRIDVTAILGPTFADRQISIYAAPARERRRLLKTARVNAHGELTVGYSLSRNTTFTAVFAGDTHNAARTAGLTVGVWVNVYMSNSGYFKTVVIDHVRYRVYHHTAYLYAYPRVVPNKAGQCVDIEVQQYGSNTWFANQTFGCYTLNKQSETEALFSLTEAAGAQYRMRADYIHSRKDTTNLSTKGSWFYFEVVK
jgi:hypothetical protein